GGAHDARVARVSRRREARFDEPARPRGRDRPHTLPRSWRPRRASPRAFRSGRQQATPTVRRDETFRNARRARLPRGCSTAPDTPGAPAPPRSARAYGPRVARALPVHARNERWRRTEGGNESVSLEHLLDPLERLITSFAFIHALAEELPQGFVEANRTIERRAGALLVGADRHQVFIFSIHRQVLASLRGKLELARLTDVARNTTDALEH